MTTKLVLIALAAGCGSAHHTVDANRDTSSDTLSQTTADAPPGAVTLTITNAGEPVAGAGVYFQNADSSLVLGATTDSHGTVGAVLAANAFVTALEPSDGSGVVKLDTFAGVQPGDALHLDLAAVGAQGGAMTALTVTPATAATASAIDVFTPCGSGALPASTGTGDIGWQGCALQTDLLIVEVDDQNAPLGEYFSADQTIGPAATDAAGYPLDVSGPAYSGLVTTTYDYGAVPDTIAMVKTTQELWSGRGRLYDASVASQRSGITLRNMLDQPVPTGAAFSAVTVSDFMPVPGGALHGEQLVYDWGPYAAGYGPLDFAQATLAPYTSDPVFDVTAHAITWTESTGAMPQFARATVSIYRDAIPAGQAWHWNIIGPRTATPSLALPVLPTDGFDYNAKDGDQIAVANLTNAKLSSGGYDNVRAHGFANVADLANPDTTATGQLVIQLPYSSPL